MVSDKQPNSKGHFPSSWDSCDHADPLRLPTGHLSWQDIHVQRGTTDIGITSSVRGPNPDVPLQMRRPKMKGNLS